jgi:hypothetical protein
MSDCRERALIDRHFAARSTPEEQAIMHAHLETCAACRDYLERHLLVAELDPAAPDQRARIAAAAGIGGRRRPRATPWVVAVLTLGAAAVAVVLMATRPHRDGEFAARGTAAEGGPALDVYCTSCGRPAPRLHDRVPARASLAFAYQNPTGWKHLMVLAVDDQGNVYWYHPDPAQSPTALGIDRSAFARELPWEIDQTFRGSTLRIVGLFSDRPLQVSAVEAAVNATGCASLRALADACVEQVVTVETP